MKKREPEDKQLCIAVHTIICSIITPRHIKINWLHHTALHNTDGPLWDDQGWALWAWTALPYHPCIHPWGKALWKTYGQAIQDTLQWVGWHCCATTLPSNMPENKSPTAPNLWTQSARTKGGWSTPATAAKVTHHLHPPRTVPTAPESTQLAEQTAQHVIPIVPNVTNGTLGTKMLWWQATPTKECTLTWVRAEEVQMPTKEPQQLPRAEQQHRHHRCQWGTTALKMR